MPRAARAEKQYHHGDLHSALIIAAAELIAERGSADFAMIDAARRAGVSSAAPYRHFKDKDDLLEGVFQLAMWAMSLHSREILEQHEIGTRECIIALGHGYVDFVTEHAPYFDLMWGDRFIHHDDDEDPVATREQSGFGLFYGAVEGWASGLGASEDDALDLAIKLWCMAHGLSGLAMNGRLDHFSPGIDTDLLLDTATKSFLDGVEMEFKQRN